jgi:hemerythrin
MLIRKDKLGNISNKEIYMEKRQLLWLEKYNTGIEKIDENRKIIFEIIKNLYSSLSSGEASHTIVSTALLVFKEQAELCFETEEDFMARIKFPYLPFHRNAHKSIMIKLDECILNMEDADLSDLNKYRNIFDFLNKWIIEHLLEEDNFIRIYVEFVKHCKKNNINVLEIKI